MAFKKPEISTKRLAISKAQTRNAVIVGISVFVVIFSLMGAKAVLSQIAYQSRVTKAQQKSYDQLKSNLKAYDGLATSYKAFDNADVNVINGTKDGTGDNDGPNSKLVLDALPSSYDFPALTSSLEKILNDQHLQIGGISGTDDQLAQQANISSPTPQSVPIPFSFSVKDANYESVKTLIASLQHSIRPIQVDTVDISGSVGDMTASITAHTYYQPAKTVNVSTKAIK